MPQGLQHLQRRPAALRLARAEQVQRQGNVLQYGQIRQHVECLKHESHVLPAPSRDGIVIQFAEVGIVEQHSTAIGSIKPGDQIQQRGFARA